MTVCLKAVHTIECLHAAHTLDLLTLFYLELYATSAVPVLNLSVWIGCFLVLWWCWLQFPFWICIRDLMEMRQVKC